MPQIKYVGAKDSETAFGDLTGGIVWTPGSSHQIADPRLAARMLAHPDVFALDVPAEQSLGLQAPPDLTDEQKAAAQAAADAAASSPDAPLMPPDTEPIRETSTGEADVDAMVLGAGTQVSAPNRISKKRGK